MSGCFVLKHGVHWYNHAVPAFSTTTPGRRGGVRPNPTNLPWIRRCFLHMTMQTNGLLKHRLVVQVW